MAGAIINPRMLDIAHPNGRLRARQRIIRARMGKITPPPVVAIPPPAAPAEPEPVQPDAPSNRLPNWNLGQSWSRKQSRCTKLTHRASNQPSHLTHPAPERYRNAPSTCTDTGPLMYCCRCWMISPAR